MTSQLEIANDQMRASNLGNLKIAMEYIFNLLETL